MINNEKIIDFTENCPQKIINGNLDLQDFNYFMTHSDNSEYKKLYYSNVFDVIDRKVFDENLNQRNIDVLSYGMDNLNIYLIEKIINFNSFLKKYEGVSVKKKFENEEVLNFIKENDEFTFLLTLISNDFYKRFLKNIRLKSIADVEVYINFLFLFLFFIIFILSLIFLFVIFPKANKLQKQIIVTIQLLNMIPIEVISEINSIREYLNKLSR